MLRQLYSGKNSFLLFLLLTAPAAKSEEGSVASPPINLWESYGPMSSSPRDDQDKSAILLGGVLKKEDEDSYRRLLNTGASPDSIPGPERIHLALVSGSSIAETRQVFSQPGYHINDPSTFRAPGSGSIAMVFSRASNRIAEECHRKEETLRSCAAYATSREIGMATSEDEGHSWTFQDVLVKAKDSGDSSGAAQPSVLLVGSELWVFYVTGKQTFVKENIFRVRFSADGKKRLSPPEPIHIEGFKPGLSLENVQLVRLHCEQGKKFVITMVANSRWQNALPFYLSSDGLNFKTAAESLVSYEERNLLSPTQMPGPASSAECSALEMSGVKTFRELLYSEESAKGRWNLRRANLRITLP